MALAVVEAVAVVEVAVAVLVLDVDAALAVGSAGGLVVCCNLKIEAGREPWASQCAPDLSVSAYCRFHQCAPCPKINL